MSLPWPTLTTEEWYERIAQAKKKDLSAPSDSSIIDLGGPGSGNFGHVGRPGEVGGSGGGDDDGDRGGGTRSGASVSQVPLQAWDADSAGSAGAGRGVRPYRDKVAWLLDGTSEGAIKGWETRRGGGGAEQAESIPAGAKGECFRNATRWVRQHDDFDLVHGKVTNGEGRTFDHAWAESAKQVADPTTGVKMDKDRWYGLVKAKPEARYSSTQSTRNMLKTGNFGPWTDDEVGVHKLSFDLIGNEHSGNYGHKGRPGEVGGSAPSEGDGGGAMDALIERERQRIIAERNAGPKPEPVVRSKKDGGKIEFTSGNNTVSPTAVTRVLGDTPNATLEGMAAQMLDDLAGDLSVTWDTAHSKDGVFYVKTGVESEEHNTVIMKVARADGLKISRTFVRLPDGSLVVQHNTFKVPTGEQGKGIAKSFLKNSYALYQKMGVDEIRTLANSEVGGYAWAKFGFKAIEPQYMATDMKTRMHDLADRGAITPDERDGIRAVIDQYKDDPKLPWHLAGIVGANGRPLGKELLLNSDWDATLSMHDAEATTRLTHYIGAD